jgi:hypothetical protein
MARKLVLHIHAPGRRSRPTAPRTAPRALRTRVLANVRGDSAACRFWARGLATVVGALLTALVAGGLWLLPSTAQRHSQARRPAGLHADLRRVGDRGELQVSGMREPPVGEVYELWLNRGGSREQPTDALFTVTSAGAANVEVPGSLHGVRALTVTAEPLGGSSRPTSPPVLSVSLQPQR